MFHRVVIEKHNNCNTESSYKLTHKNKIYHVRKRIEGKKYQNKIHSPMKNQQCLFQISDFLIHLTTWLFHVRDKEPALNTPDDPKNGTERKKIVSLPWDGVVEHRLGRGTAPALHSFKVIHRPQEKGKIVNIRICFEDICDGVMAVVSFLPPSRAVTLQDISEKIANVWI